MSHNSERSSKHSHSGRSNSSSSSSSTSSQTPSSRSHVHRTQRTSPTWSPSATSAGSSSTASIQEDLRSSRATLPRTSITTTTTHTARRRRSSSSRHSSSSSPKITTSGSRKNVPNEASFSNFESYASELHDPHLVSEELRQEFSRSNLADISGTSCDPERFFRSSSSENCCYFERKVNPHKIIDFMVNYMNSYFDLVADPKPYSSHRENLDEHLWDHLAYVFPIACRNVVDDVLHEEPLVVTMVPNVVVFGDIHGNLSDIYYIYKHYIINKKYCSHKFVFLGDYVDRGPKSIEVCMFLITCKLIDPKRFVLLRGNHEVSKVNTKYGFKCLVETIFKETYLKSRGMLAHLIYDSFIRVFNNLPVAAAIRFKEKRGVFCCHGGIPNERYKSEGASAWKVSDINAFTGSFKPHNLVPRRNCPTPQIVLNELLWNDPIPRKVWEKRRNIKRLFYKNKKRGGHCSWFTEEAVNRFLEANNMRLVIRGHQYKNTRENGYAYHFPGQQVVTIFSSSNYCGIEDNVTGCVVISEDNIQPKVLRAIEESKNYRQFNAFELITDDNKKVVGVVY